MTMLNALLARGVFHENGCRILGNGRRMLKWAREVQTNEAWASYLQLTQIWLGPPNGNISSILKSAALFCFSRNKRPQLGKLGPSTRMTPATVLVFVP